MAFNRSKWNTFFCFDIKTVSSSKKNINFLVFNFLVFHFTSLPHILHLNFFLFYLFFYFCSLYSFSSVSYHYICLISVSLSFYWLIFYLSFRFLHFSLSILPVCLSLYVSHNSACVIPLSWHENSKFWVSRQGRGAQPQFKSHQYFYFFLHQYGSLKQGRKSLTDTKRVISVH